MARITVEDCLKKIDSQYDLVLLAKERAAQLNSGENPLVPKDNDKNTVIALREIGEGKISLKSLEDSAINKLRKQQEEVTSPDDLEEEQDDTFDQTYKGEVSKSGAAILPSKRVRRMPEKIVFEKKETEELSENTENEAEINETAEKEPEELPADNKSE
jgi:DNA-directed RNA polymerase subunit omega